jgi:putative nucleotidyltransferase with HDIG domain
MVRVDDMLNRVEQLPTLPASASKVITLLMKNDGDLREVSDVIMRDEALTMTVLRYANSARYGRPGRMFKLNEAVVRLGRKLLMRIALEHETCSLFADAGTAYGLRRGSLWRGSMGGAIAADLIARDHLPQHADLCFICALLRDVGKLVLDAQNFCDQLAAIDPPAIGVRTFIEGERSVMGVDHAELGAAIATRWNLPQQVIKAIRYHHHPPAEGDDADLLYDIVHAADVICLWAGLAVGHDGLNYQLVPHVRERLFASRSQAELYMSATWNQLAELEHELGLSWEQGKSA